MKSVYHASVPYAFAMTLGNRALRPAALRCLFSIFRNFFFSQFCFALLPGRVPVSRGDHPLDRKIPFLPEWVDVYIDFVAYWLRMITFLSINYGRRSHAAIFELLVSMGKLYEFAGQIYRKNLSTTDRPFYIARRRFFTIHLLDPHLMCIPSLHVMVVAFAHAKFEAALQSLGGEGRHSVQLEETRQGAQAICRAILFVKQHSVNCIGASLYALTRFDAKLFPAEKAEAFCAALFTETPAALQAGTDCLRAGGNRAECRSDLCRKCRLAVPATPPPPPLADEIRAHITASFRRFYAEGITAQKWDEPLLRFLRGLPRK